MHNKQNVIVYNSNEKCADSVDPESITQCREYPGSSIGNAVSSRVCNHSCNTQPKCSKKEALVRVAKSLFESVRVVIKPEAHRSSDACK